MLKLNSHAIEYIKSGGRGDVHKQEMAREFLHKAETVLLNTPEAVFKQGGVAIKNKLLAITQNNLG